MEIAMSNINLQKLKKMEMPNYNKVYITISSDSVYSFKTEYCRIETEKDKKTKRKKHG